MNVKSFSLCVAAAKQRNRSEKQKQKSTNNWARKFTNWLKKNSIEIMAEGISSSELDKILQHFFAELRKEDGTNYEPVWERLGTRLALIKRRLSGTNLGSEITCRHFD